jgi:hypothetical protein
MVMFHGDNVGCVFNFPPTSWTGCSRPARLHTNLSSSLSTAMFPGDNVTSESMLHPCQGTLVRRWRVRRFRRDGGLEDGILLERAAGMIACHCSIVSSGKSSLAKTSFYKNVSDSFLQKRRLSTN